jgi:hypothetical protein
VPSSLREDRRRPKCKVPYVQSNDTALGCGKRGERGTTAVAAGQRPLGPDRHRWLLPSRGQCRCDCTATRHQRARRQRRHPSRRTVDRPEGSFDDRDLCQASGHARSGDRLSRRRLVRGLRRQIRRRNLSDLQSGRFHEPRCRCRRAAATHCRALHPRSAPLRRSRSEPDQLRLSLVPAVDLVATAMPSDMC